MSHISKHLMKIGLIFAFFSTILFVQPELSLAQVKVPKSPGDVQNFPKTKPLDQKPIDKTGRLCPDLAITAFTAQKEAPDKIKFIGTVKNVGSQNFVSKVYIAGDASLWLVAIYPNGQERFFGSWGVSNLAVGQEFSPSPSYAWPLVCPPPPLPGNPVEFRFRIKYNPINTPDCSTINNQLVIPYTTIEQIMK